MWSSLIEGCKLKLLGYKSWYSLNLTFIQFAWYLLLGVTNYWLKSKCFELNNSEINCIYTILHIYNQVYTM